MKKLTLVTAISLATVSQFSLAQDSINTINSSAMRVESSATTSQIDKLKKELKLAEANINGLDAAAITNIINDATTKLKSGDQRLVLAKLILRSAKAMQPTEPYAEKFLAHFQSIGLLTKQLELHENIDGFHYIQDAPVTIDQAMFNNSLNDMTNAKVVINTSDNLEVNKNHFDIGDISFLSSKKTDSQLKITALRDATCGEAATIDVTYSGLINGKTVSDTKSYETRIGKGFIVNRRWSDEERSLVLQLRKMISKFEETRDLRMLGGWKPGSDPELDKAVETVPVIYEAICQPPNAPLSDNAFDDLIAFLKGNNQPEQRNDTAPNG